MSQVGEFAGDAGVIFLCCVLNETTRNLTNRDLFQHCKAGVTIINIDRGKGSPNTAVICADIPQTATYKAEPLLNRKTFIAAVKTLRERVWHSCQKVHRLDSQAQVVMNNRLYTYFSMCGFQCSPAGSDKP